MYIETVPNRKSPPAVLLREGWREGKRVRKRTLANLTSWPAEKVETLRRLLKNEPLVSRDDAFDIIRYRTATSLPYSALSMRLDRTIASATSPERDRVLALITARILAPGSKTSHRPRPGRGHRARSWPASWASGRYEDDLPWTGYWNARTALSGVWPSAIYKTVRWCSTT